jgi:hypothetical protein
MPNVAADLTRILGRERVLREPEHLPSPEESHEAAVRIGRSNPQDRQGASKSANPGCSVQVQAGTRQTGPQLRMMHPVSLQAQAYRSGYPNRKA